MLKRLMPEDDKHTIIEQTTIVEVFPDSLLTYKIPCYRKPSPCKIVFRYPDFSYRQNLMVYISNDDPIPNDKKYDVKESNPI